MAAAAAAVGCAGCGSSGSSFAESGSDAEFADEFADESGDKAEEEKELDEEDFTLETPDEAESGAENEADDDEEAEERSHNYAKVFEVNPVSTPQQTGVELAGAADDLDGSLVSAADADGCRKLRVLSCRDEGETSVINVGNGPVAQRVCTLKTLANKYFNGNFDYGDYVKAAAGEYDPDDARAEVELYYHAQKMYAFLTDSRIGLWDKLPGRHLVGGGWEPLTLIANFRLPNPDGDLKPVSMSMFVPEEYRAKGMAAIYGINGYVGDALVFGQGEKADFAYDGETVCHEFAHWVNYALASLSNETAIDEYGMTNQISALEQGLAETLVFLVSGRTRFFEYIDKFAGPGFARSVENECVYPDNIKGFDQFDGLIIAGANYEAYKKLEAEYSFDAYRFAKVVLKAIASLKDAADKRNFKGWAEALAAETKSEAGDEAASAVGAAMRSRGLSGGIRAKNITGYSSGTNESMLLGGTIDKMWNTVLPLNTEGSIERIATADVQCVIDAPAGLGGAEAAIGLMLTETVDSLGMYDVYDDWNLSLLVRKGAPIIYSAADDKSYSALYDYCLQPSLSGVSTPLGERAYAKWTLTGLENGASYYVHFINKGTSSCALIKIEVSAKAL